ncbi:MAG: molybdate ABC transporter permease subunit [Planctomycetota bacterium]
MNGSDVLEITALTLRVGLTSTLMILVPGVALGYLLARREFPGKTLVQTLVALPMVLPPVAVGLGLLMLLSRRGALGRAAESLLGGPLLLSWWAAALAAAVMSFPLLVRGAEQGFAGVPKRLEQVARSLGASPARVFRSVTLPLAARGILHGLVFAFARALGEFGATTLVAGNVPGRTETLALGMYARIEDFRTGEALVLAGVSVALALVITGCAEALLRRRRA